jgi:hypothetical protein
MFWHLAADEHAFGHAFAQHSYRSSLEEGSHGCMKAAPGLQDYVPPDKDPWRFF